MRHVTEIAQLSVFGHVAHHSPRAPQLASRRRQLTALGLLLAGTALVPVQAQTLDLAGVNQTLTTFAPNDVVTNTIGIATATLDIAVSDTFSGHLTQSGGGVFALSKIGAGTLALNQNGGLINDFSGGTTINGGIVSFSANTVFGSGAITVAGPSTLTPVGVGRVIANQLNVDAALTVTGASTYSGLLTGGATITHSGAGVTNFTNGASSFTGSIRLNGGGIGATTGAIGAGAISTANTAVILAAAVDSNVTLANAIVIGDLGLANPGSALLNIEMPTTAGNVMTLSGPISGPGRLFLKSGAGTLLLSSANSYGTAGSLFQPKTLVASGVLGVGAQGAVVGGISSTGSFGIASFVDALVLNNSINTTTAGAHTVTFDTRGFNTTYNSAITNTAGTLGVTKTGLGTLTIINSTSTYAGATNVDGGRLDVNAALPAAGGVFVNNGGTLGGTGAIAGAVTVAAGGSIGGGTAATPGTLSLGSLTMDAGSQLNARLTTPGFPGGAGNDLIAVGGNAVINGTVNLVPTAGTGLREDTYFILTSATLSGAPVVGVTPAGFVVTLDTLSSPNTLLANVTYNGVRAWDGAGPAANGVIDGGAGTWDDATLNFTDIASGTGELAWAAGSDASFGGTGGAVTVAGAKSVGDVAFAVDGYALSGDALTLNGGTTAAGASVFDVAGGATATINNAITGNAGIALDKRGAGTLVLAGTVTAAEATAVRVGTLQIDGTHAGDVGVRDGATVAGSGTVTGALAIGAGGGTLSPGGAGVATLNAGQLVLNTGTLAFDVTPGGASDLINVTGAVTLSGMPSFDLNLLAAATPSVTTLITYGGSLSVGANSFQIGSPIASGFAQSINTNTAGQVNLIIDSTTVLHWDGAGPAGNDVVNGGNGTWTNNPATTNWTNASGMLATSWAGTSGVFGGAGGTVTVDNGSGNVAFEDLTFNSSYTFNGDTLTALGSFATNYSEITVAAGQTVTINNNINATGAASFDKYGAGTLVLNGTITKDDTHVVHAGTTVLNGTFNNRIFVQSGGTLAGSGTADALTVFGGGTVAPGTGALDYQTLSITNNVSLGAASLAFELSTPGVGGTYDRLAIGGNLTLTGNATFNLSGPGASVVGDYSLITYGGTFTSNGFGFLTGTAPAGVAFTVVDPATTLGSIVVNVSLTSSDLYWDGAGALNGSLDGGTGTWNSGVGASTNWANITGAVNSAWVPGANAFFGVSGGTVTVDGPQVVGDMTFDAGSYTLAGSGITSNTGNIILNAEPINGGTTIASAISGTNGLTTSGIGVLFLSGANDFTGAVTLGSTGEVRLGNSSAFGAAANVVTMTGTDRLVTVVDGLTIANDIALAGFARTIDTAGFAATFSGDFSGGALNKAGAGTLTLTGTNSFTDFTNVLAGTLAVGSAGALGNQALFLEAGTKLQAAATLNFNNLVALAGNASVDTNGFDLRLDGDVVDGGAGFTLTKIGAGTLTLTGANAFGGGANINAGTLAIDDAAAIGSGAIALADGTTLRAGIVNGQSITLANALSVASGTATIDQGPASLTFNDASVSVSGTTLAINGAVTGAGTLALSGGATRLADTSGFTGNLSLVNGALLDLVDASSLGSGVLLSAGSNSIRNNSGAALSFANTVTATGGFFVVNGTDDVALTGAVSAAILAKVGTATLTLANGGNAFTDVQIYNGTLVVGANGALGNALVTTGPSTLRAAADNLSFANAFDGGIGGNLTVDTQAFTLTLSGNKISNGGLIKTGTGTLILGGTNNYVGDTDINQGTIDLQGTIANDVNVAADGRLMGAGSVGGTVTFADGADVNPGNSPGTLTFGNLVLGNATNLNFELAGVAGVPGVDADLIDVTNNLTLDGVLSITGLPGFNVGVGNRTIITYGNLVADGGLTVATAAPVDVSYSILTGPVASGAGIVQLNVAFTGTYRWDGSDLAPDGTIDGGDGIFNLANTNFTNSDGSFNLAYGNNATDDIEFGGAAGNVDVASAGLNFDQMTFATTGYTLGGVGSFNAAGSAINVGANTATINTAITGGALTKNGAGTLVLGGNNSNATLAVTAGTLVAASDTALGAGTATFTGGTTLVAQGAVRTIANDIAIAGAGGLNVRVNANTLTLDGDISGTGPVRYATNSGGFLGDTVNINGTNSYTGGTTVSGTTIVVGADAALGNAAGSLSLTIAQLTATNSFTTNRAISLNGGSFSVINVNDAQTLTANGLVSGVATAPLLKVGLGTLVLGNAGNTYAGGTQIFQGTVSVASNGALGALSGGITMANDGVLQLTADVTSARSFNLVGNGVVDTQGNDVLLTGTVFGGTVGVDNGRLSKEGTGRLTLTGTNTYTGGTNLNEGTLRIDDGNAIGSGRLQTQDGTTFTAGLAPGAGTITLAASNNVVLTGGQTTIDLVGTTFAVNGVTGAVTSNGTNLIINGVISGLGGFTTNVATTGQIVLNGNNSFSGDVTLNNAVAFVGNDNALGVNNTVNLNAFGGIRNAAGGTTRTLANNIFVNDPNATLGGNGNIVVNGVVSGSDPAVLNKVGLGTVTLANANNSIAAQIEVAQGELAITGALTNAAQLTNVRAGATLSGTGSIAGTVEVVNSGVLSAGIGGNGSVGALSIGRLLLNEQSSLVFDLGAANVQGGALNDQINVGSLRLGGRLTVREATGGSFGLGIYNLMTYQGALEAGSNGVFVQTLPGAFSGVVQTVIPGEVNLVVTNPGTLLLSWDGADNTGGTNGAQGGSGTWSAAGTNWTGEDPAELNTTWFNGSVATFRGAAGTVTLDGTFNAAGFQFTTDGYTLQQGLIDNQSTGIGTGMFIATSGGVTATINTRLQGDGITFKQGAGTLVLGGNNTGLSGDVQVQAGTLALTANRAAGTGTIALGGNTTLAAGVSGLTVANAITTAGVGTIDSGTGTLALTGVISGPGSIVKTSTGSLTLTGTNSYVGGTTLNAGELIVSRDANLGDANGAVTFNGNSQLTIENGATAFDSVRNIVSNTSATIRTNGTAPVTLNGTVSGNGDVFKTGAGTLVLTGANSYAGGTFIGNGVLSVSNDGNLGAANGAITFTSTGLGVLRYTNGATAVTSNRQIGLTTNGTIDATGTADVTFNGQVAGNGRLIKTGTGAIVLNGVNSYAGGTALNAGTITVGNDSALGGAALDMAGGTTLRAGVSGLTIGNAITTAGVGTIDSGTGVFTLGGVISGVGSITKVNSGNLVLNGANGYAGGTNVAAGTVTVGNNSAFGTGLVTMADGTVLANNVSGLDIANAFSIGNVEVATGGSLFTMSGQIGGAGLLTKTGTGRLVLTGDNSYAGGTALTAGSLVIGSNTALGTGTLTTTDGVGVLAGVNDPSTATLTLANNVVLGAGTTNLDLQGTEFLIFGSGDASFNGTNLTLNGMVSGDGALSVFDNGRLNLNGANSYAGGTTVNNAAIFVGTDSALGTGTVTSDSMVLGNDSGALRTLANAFVLNSSMAVGGLNDITLNGVISGGAGIIKGFNTTLTLNGDNSYSGVTELFGGRITVGTNTALGTSNLNVFNAAGQTTTLAAGTDGLALANTIGLFGSNLIVESGTGTFTLNGVISGTGALTKIQSGNLVLNGVNTYTGGTELNAGTITVGTNTALGVDAAPGSSRLAMAGGTTLAAGVSGLVVANNITTAGVGTIDSGTGVFTLGGVISGAGSLTKVNTGTLVLNGDDSYQGGTALNAGTIQVGTSTALGTGTLTAADATSLVAGVSGLNVANTVVLNGGLTVDSSTGSFELSGGISGMGSITKVNSGNLILSGSNSYAGGTNLNAGTLTITNDNSIGTGTLTTTGGTTLTVGTVTGASAAITLANAVVLGAGTTTVNLQGTTLTFNNDGSIVTDGAALTLNGVVSGDGALATGNFGTLTLNGANSYAGGTLINTRSVVYVGSDTAVGTGTVTMGGATGLYNFSGATRTLANAFTLNGGSWLGGGNDLVLNGTISGTGFVIKGGAQTLVLNGANDFTGTSQLRDGRITVGTDTALGQGALRVFAPTVLPAPAAGLATTLAAGSSGLTLANAITLDAGSNLIVESGAGVFTLNGVISGAGSLTKIDGGNLVLNGDNTYTGGTALNVGTITVGTDTALGTNTLTMATNTTLAAGVSGLVVANNIVTLGNGIVDQGAGVFTLNGIISGAGSISAVGSGNLVLNGNNSFVNLGINNGRVTVGTNTAAGIGDISMSTNTTLAAGVSGLVLANGIQTLGNGIVDQGMGTFTLNGNIAGPGSISAINSGNLILNGNNSFVNLGINNGTVTVGTNTAAGIGDISMSTNTTLAAGVSGLVLANGIQTLGNGIVDQGTGVFTLNGNIAGPGSISTVNTGNLVLNGNNSFVNLGIGAGTVTVGTNTAAGIGDIAIASGSTLAAGVSGLVLANGIQSLGNGIVDQGTGTFTLNGNIAGPGSISTVNIGNLVLNGNNSFVNLGIGAGTVTVGTNTAAGIGDIAIASGSTLAAGVSGLVLTNGIQTLGNGIVDQGAGTFTLNGNIAGPGSISTVGNGILVLNGNNSFVNLGIGAGTVQVGTNTAAGLGDIAIGSGSTLAAGVSGLVLTNGIQSLGNGIVDQGTGVFTLTGNIAGPGSISTVNTGNLVLTGNNSFVNLGIGAGTVTVTTDTAAGIGDIAIGSGSTLAAGVSGLVLANGIQTLGNGIVNQGEAPSVLTLNGNIAGPGSISAVGSGNLVLNGNNSFVNLGINRGTVTVGTSTAAGVGDIAIASNSTLAAGVSGLVLANGIETLGNGIVNQGEAPSVFTLNGNINGAGSISAVGSGNLVLNGNNGFRNLGINRGTVTVGTSTAAGVGDIAIASNTTLAAGRSGLVLANGIQTLGNGIVDQGEGMSVFTLNGNINGAGSISAVGSGNLVLNGNNGFRNLGINRGTVTVGTNTAAGVGDIAIASNTTLAAGVSGLVLANGIETLGNGIVNQGEAPSVFTLNGNINGAGSISAVGSGNLVLNGNNGFVNLGINRGTVTVGTNTAAGSGEIAIAGGATLAAGVSGLNVANRIQSTGAAIVNSGAGTFTLSGLVGGLGGITKTGTGTLNITAAGDLRGATIVNQGTLNLTGSLSTSATTVQTGAFLVGTGTTGALTVQSGGTVSPGSTTGAIATLNVNGSATLAAGSTLRVDVTPTSNDRLAATGALSIAGNLAVSPTGTFSTFYQSFTIASGSSRTGTFANASLGNFGVPFVPVLDYTATGVNIRLTPASLVSIGGATLTGNALSVAGAFDRGVQGGYNPQPFLNLYLQGANLPTALGQLSGEVHAAETRVLLEDTRVVREAAFDRLNSGIVAANNGASNTVDRNDSQITFWARGVGSWGTAGADGVGSRFTTEQTGIVTGIDVAKGDFKFGAMFNRTSNDVRFNSALGQSTVTSTGGALYAGWRQPTQGFAIGVGAAVAGTGANASRSVTAPGLAQSLRSSYNGTSWQLFGEVAYDLSASDTVRLEPFARLAYANVGHGGFAETGGIAALTAGRQDRYLTVVDAGFRGAVSLDKFELMGSLAWHGVYGSRGGFSQLGITGLNSIADIQATTLDRNAAAIDLQARYSISSKVTLGVGYSGVHGSRNSDNGARATLTIGF